MWTNKMKGRYLQPKNAWELAWNAAMDSREVGGLDKAPNEPYEAAWRASDAERKKQDVPQHGWCYEECRRHTQTELENRKKLEEWASRYMQDEEERRRKRTLR